MAPQCTEGEPSTADPDALAFSNWNDLYRDNVGWLYRWLHARVRNRTDAEDLTSEVFLAVLRPLRTTASRREVRAYLKATARTVLARHWRQPLEVGMIHGHEDASIAYVDEALDPRMAGRARAILDAVSERHRTILQLRFVQGMPVKDAAQAMGITVGNARVLQHRALTAAAQVNLS